MVEILDRRLLDELAKGNPRLREGLEQLLSQVAENTKSQSLTIDATTALEDATVLVLSPNAAFNNERILAVGDGLAIADRDGRLIIAFADGVVSASGGFKVQFVAAGDSAVVVPLGGVLATTGNPETLANKTLASPKITGLADHADDAAAAAGGVPVNGLYRTGSIVKVRVS